VTPVELRHVSKTFGHITVCDDIDLAIAEGEFLTLLGSSGCGKTTTLNMIAGLEDASAGDILMNGVRVNDLSPVKRDVAMVFQNFALYPHMNVAENIGFTLRMRKMSAAEIKTRVARVADALELTLLLARLPAQLSGGQQQRVAIGRALVREPRVFLFDEPFSNLDAALRVKMRAEVKELHHRLGVTSIFVTHDQEEALEVANRVVVMDKGRIEQIGTPGEVYDSPATAFVHGFIGESIVLPVDVRDGCVRLGDKALKIAADGASSGASKLFVRRHDMQVGPAGSGSLEGAVRHVRSFGPIQRAEVALRGGEVIEIDAPRDRELQTGEIVGLEPRRYRIFAA
jgi:sulfate transport system ATP-binding protein